MPFPGWLRRQLGSDPASSSGLLPGTIRQDSYDEAQRQWAINLIKNNAQYICDAAKRYNITPDAIAGVILWEALENPYDRWTRGQGPLIFSRPGGLNDFGIPGKIHTNPGSEAELVESVVKQNRPDAFVDQGWRQDVGGVPYRLSPQDLRKERLLKDPTVAIEYSAAILDRSAKFYEQQPSYHPDIDIRNQAGVLGALYQGGNPSRRAQSFNGRRSDYLSRNPNTNTAPLPQLATSEAMGPWMSQHRQWIRNLLKDNNCQC